MSELRLAQQSFFGSRVAKSNTVSQVILLDGTLFTVSSTAPHVCATYTISKGWLSNSVYTTDYVTLSFEFWSSGATTNDFWISVDGVEKRRFGDHVTAAGTTYSVALKLTNNMDHTIEIIIDENGTSNVRNFQVEAIARLI